MNRATDTRARTTQIWALGFAAFAAICALTEMPMLPQRLDPGPVAGWVLAGVAVVALLAVTAVRRWGIRPRLRQLLIAVCVPLGLAAFSLLMDLIGLLFLTPIDNWSATVTHLLSGLGVVLLLRLAGSDRQQVEGSPPPASAGGRGVQIAAVVGTLAFVPYVTMKQIWSFGGSFAGVNGAEVLAASEANGASGIWLALESAGLDPTALLAGLGVFLLWGLVRPWGQVFPRWIPWLGGRRVPRWLPLAPAVIGAATLCLYGVVGLGYVALAAIGTVPLAPGDLPTRESSLLVSLFGMIAFAGYGTALAIAAGSYWRRTRPVITAVVSPGRVRPAW